MTNLTKLDVNRSVRKLEKNLNVLVKKGTNLLAKNAKRVSFKNNPDKDCFMERSIQYVNFVRS